MPILSLWRPKQIANDIWRASAPAGTSPVVREPGWLLRLWWIGFIASWVVTRITGSNGRESTPADFQATTTGFLVSDSLDFVVAALAILVVRQMTRRMDARAAEAEAARSEPEDAGGRASVADPWSTRPTT